MHESYAKIFKLEGIHMTEGELFDGINGSLIECSADDIDGEIEDGMIRMYNSMGYIEYCAQKLVFEASIHLDEYEDLLLELTKDKEQWI